MGSGSVRNAMNVSGVWQVGQIRGKTWSGDLRGEGVVLLDPGRDQRSQGRVGGEDPVVAVAVEPGRRKDLGQPVQEIEGREAQRGRWPRCGRWRPDRTLAPFDHRRSV